MTWPFDPYQTVLLLIAGLGALGGYFHVKFQTTQNAKDLEIERAKNAELAARVAALELANAGHAATVATIENFKEALGEMKQELQRQRVITAQLERIVAKLGGALKIDT